MSTPGQPTNSNSASPVGNNLQLMESYSFIKQSPNWMMNLLLGVVCQVIPFIGPIVFMGYEFEIIEALHRDPRRVYPDFDFGRFGTYLGRGIWPFLAVMVTMMIIMPMLWLVTALPVLLAVSIGGEDSAMAGIASVLAMIAFIIALVLAMLLVTPMMLRAGLAQDFASAFSLQFLKDYLRRMWVETLIATVFLMVSSIVAMFAGLLLCCVGMYPAMVAVSMAQFHLMYQLYEIYLHRGGMPIPLKDPV